MCKMTMHLLKHKIVSQKKQSIQSFEFCYERNKKLSVYIFCYYLVRLYNRVEKYLMYHSWMFLRGVELKGYFKYPGQTGRDWVEKMGKLLSRCPFYKIRTNNHREYWVLVNSWNGQMLWAHWHWCSISTSFFPLKLFAYTYLSYIAPRVW